MTRLAITFLVGVFLFVAGGTGEAWAVTFKDGKVSKDNQVEEPAQKVERKSSGGFLGQLFGNKSVQIKSNLPECPSDMVYLKSDFKWVVNSIPVTCFGFYQFSDGGHYNGEIRNGLLNGRGAQTWANGDKYIGEYRNNMPHGNGTYNYSDGSKYVGNWINNKRDGQGTFIWGSNTKWAGDKYVGEWKDDNRTGQGTYFLSDGGKQIGEFKDNKLNGQVTVIYADGGKFVGEFKNDLRNGQGVITYINGAKFVGKFKDGLANGQGTMNYSDGSKYVGNWINNKRDGQGTFIWGSNTKWAGDKYVGEWKDDNRTGQGTYFLSDGGKQIGEFKDNKLNGYATYYKADGSIDRQGIWKNDEFQYAEKPPSTNTNALASSAKPTSAELIAAQRKAEQLEAELTALKTQQAQTENEIASDTQVPLITITSSSSNGPQGTISGRVSDNAGVGEVRVDGQLIQLDASGNFTTNTYVPTAGISVIIEAVDAAGLSSSMSVRLDRSANTSTASISFDRLNPLGRKVAQNDNALALIIGVDNYEITPARAIYADSDAQVFTDYASEKLGIPSNRIKTLVNDGAGEREMLLSVKSWLTRSVQQDKTDVYIFFAGHGLASDDGQKMYLLPYDGAPELLDDTAISRERLFSDISATNPRSVTVFLDTCYSGTTRGTDVLIASRPIGIRALEQSIPDNFTVMTAAAGDQTAKPLEEAKHGMFSYFLMKGMEGEADANNDNEITAGELHAYVEQNVVQQSSGSQAPELQGDASRVLVQFQ